MGCFGRDLIFVAYCRDSFARLGPKLGLCASTYKLSTGDVLNTKYKTLDPELFRLPECYDIIKLLYMMAIHIKLHCDAISYDSLMIS